MICLEHQILTRQAFNNQNDFDYLLNQQFDCFDIVYHQNNVVLKAKHYLAVILLPSGQTLEILPKITPITTSSHTTDALYPFSTSSTLTPVSTRQNIEDIKKTRQWVHRMLARIINQQNISPVSPLPSAISLTSTHSQSHMAHQNSTWYQWLYTEFLQNLEQLAQLNPRKYQTKHLNAPNALGKLNVKQQLKHNHHRPHYLATEHAQLSSQQLLWQFLNTAFTQIKSIMGQCSTPPSSHLYQQLNHHPLPMAKWHPTYQSLTHQIPKWRHQYGILQTKKIEQSLQWAWWLLQPLSQTPQYHHQHSHHQLQHAFMINMWQAFESWVYATLTDLISTQHPHHQVVRQPTYDWLIQSDNHTNHHHVIKKIKPDICILDSDNHVTHVIDVKYKTNHKTKNGADFNKNSTIVSNDLYQIGIYQHHLKAKYAWLIYPASQTFCQCQTFSSALDSQTKIQLIPFDVENEKLIL